MYLQLPPSRFKELSQLVEQFNAVMDSDPVQQLFYLQKINYVLNKTKLDEELFTWMSSHEKEGWINQLTLFNINPNASFFYKNFQFAQAVTHLEKDAVDLHNQNNDIYRLMKHRDELIKNQSFEHCRSTYITINRTLCQLAQTDLRIKDIIKKQAKVLQLAHEKFEAIKGNITTKNSSYYTEPLGKEKVNNDNFEFTIKEWPDPFVFRVEDRSELGLEQELHSYQVAEYFIEDYAVFMMAFKGSDDHSTAFRPVVLSQLANQGNLADVARALKNQPQEKIAAEISYYFTQLTDLCQKLIEEGVYHPDIKLTNFLVHNNKLLISDRKTLINIENPKVTQVRSTPLFAPVAYVNCLNNSRTGYRFNANLTTVNMPQFMAYQLGMALKEFLVWTQCEELPLEFRDINTKASSYFTNPKKQIQNLAILVQELTREDASKRFSIKQLQSLITSKSYLKNTDGFYEQLEKLLPPNQLGIQEEINKITALLCQKITTEEDLKQANAVFNTLLMSDPKEPRLVRMAEQLALKCFYDFSIEYFKNFSKSIEAALDNQNWMAAPWYRKLIHYLTFGLYNVDQVTEVSDIQIQIDFKSPEFQMHLPQLNFISPEILQTLGKQESVHFQDFILSHLDEIEARDSTLDKNEALNTCSKSIELSETCASIHEESSIIKITCDSPANHHKDLEQRSKFPSCNEDESSLESGTILKAESNKTASVNQPKVGFFFDVESPNSHQEEKKTVHVRRFSVRTTLFQGDGSGRYKKLKERPVLPPEWQQDGSHSSEKSNLSM